jgi:hypothetical protein
MSKTAACRPWVDGTDPIATVLECLTATKVLAAVAPEHDAVRAWRVRACSVAVRDALAFALLLLLSMAGAAIPRRSKDTRAILVIPITSQVRPYCWLRTLALLQASCRRIGRVADGVAGYEKFHSPVLLPAGGVTV